MTNVPDNIRALWKDIYVLFDTHWNMDNTAKAWEEFWEKAKEIYGKIPDDEFRDNVVIELLENVAKMIEWNQSNKNTLTWKPDEEYPYPKGDVGT